MADSSTLLVNGVRHDGDSRSNMPPPWVLRGILGLIGTEFVWRIAQCGACTVQPDGQPLGLCLTPIVNVAGRVVANIEAIGDTPVAAWARKAWRDLEVVKCGYCQCSQMVSATTLSTRGRHDAVESP
jgi:isoquinoline 1-oxidoreductase alpha subunit